MTSTSRPAVAYLIIILAIVYIIGFVYINVIWSLANVISVLEDLKGFGAMKKSKALLKGKMFVASALFVLIYLPLSVVQFGFQVVLDLGRFGIGSKVGIGAICFFLTLVLILLGLVIQTIIYFVCKAYHHETIDKSNLANHLEVFMPAYVPLAERNIQLEQSNV
ncbi:Polyadenylate-binding protein 1-b-binding protein [Thalictrum thalictroides]|uniref:Polyadenylate-binding protein 1-b-binding protein n=1 Tax=Thalictrum thalictroides TaxID=46969 RepID=A0A7J6WIT6_THATH|nr:Polyadenylate-binding protein 1-b-binding protein [Thalictrum thalictroides]